MWQAHAYASLDNIVLSSPILHRSRAGLQRSECPPPLLSCSSGRQVPTQKGPEGALLSFPSLTPNPDSPDSTSPPEASALNGHLGGLKTPRADFTNYRLAETWQIWGSRITTKVLNALCSHGLFFHNNMHAGSADSSVASQTSWSGGDNRGPGD